MKVFVAAPFGSKLSSDGTFETRYRHRLMQLHNNLESSGYSIFASQRNEDWGNAALQPEDYVPVDFRELQSSDVVVAVLGASPSLGVCIELGWASAMRIPIVIIGRKSSCSSMISGLHRVGNVRYIISDLEDEEPSDQQLFAELVQNLKGVPRGSRASEYHWT